MSLFAGELLCRDVGLDLVIAANAIVTDLHDRFLALEQFIYYGAGNQGNESSFAALTSCLHHRLIMILKTTSQFGSTHDLG
jgi:hypothetical protein